MPHTQTHTHRGHSKKFVGKWNQMVNVFCCRIFLKSMHSLFLIQVFHGVFENTGVHGFQTFPPKYTYSLNLFSIPQRTMLICQRAVLFPCCSSHHTGTSLPFSEGTRCCVGFQPIAHHFCKDEEEEKEGSRGFSGVSPIISTSHSLVFPAVRGHSRGRLLGG